MTQSDSAGLPFWRCSVCGYVTQAAEPPDVCPVCGATREYFRRFEPTPEMLRKLEAQRARRKPGEQGVTGTPEP